MARLFIGTSGWSYPHWRGRFYPPDLPHAHELQYASAHFASIEINRSFYSLLTPASCRAWYAQTPPGFVFALKGSRFITHIKRLKDPHAPLANFFASGPLALEEKLGPIVWQLPAKLAFDRARVEAFFDALPRTSREAAALAARHDARLKRGAHVTTTRNRRLRYAIEPRHESFFTPEFVAIARRHRIALVIADSASWPLSEEITAGFVYARLHGSARTYASQYTPEEIARWAARFGAWARGEEPKDARRITQRPLPRATSRDVYVYFDNDAAAYAANDALELAGLMDAGPCVPSSPLNAASTLGALNANARTRRSAKVLSPATH